MALNADSGFRMRFLPSLAILAHLALSAAPLSLSLNCLAIPSSLLLRTDASSNGGSIPAAVIVG